MFKVVVSILIIESSALLFVAKGNDLRRIKPLKSIVFDTLFDFEQNGEEALEFFERIDDQVMGGVSTSNLLQVQNGDNTQVVWSGLVRTDGGGFCGTRTVRLEKPIDLSIYSGLWIQGKLTSDSDIRRRVWKCSMRLEQNAGELVYSSEWIPDGTQCLVPFSSFKLVRGPRFVPNASPLSIELLRKVYGIGLTVSKFGLTNTTQQNNNLLPNFRDGFFRVHLNAIGVYGDLFPARSGISIPLPQPDLNNPSKPNSANSNNLIIKSLSPISRFVFSQKAKRRATARRLISKRKQGTNARLYGQKVIKRGVKQMSPIAATIEGISQLSADFLRSIIAFPLRLTFRFIFAIIRLRRGALSMMNRKRNLS
mmetsp:Transcript_485/g.626  ORF Transcript_485/g.626 Transcript_485/m.626 type:complete len:366 (-) Transcript_485:59-1156(-)